VNTATGGYAIWAEGKAKVNVLEITGGDLAEPFEVTSEEERCVEPGLVVVIDAERPGKLRIAERAFDERVAGVISGANGLDAGVVLKAEGLEHADVEYPVAMSGRVWCWADATTGAIRPGDRLTTSNTPGHAMRVDRQVAAIGAVIGKAMTGLDAGTGLVLVLVDLH
jgi:hypothetical protein